MQSGVAKRPIEDMQAYRRSLSGRLNPAANFLQGVFDRISPHQKQVVFAEGEEEVVIRAALAFRNAGYGQPILVGRERRILETVEALGLDGAETLPIINAKISDHNTDYIQFLYDRLQRTGSLYRDCQRMVNLDRNVFAACMVANGHADALVTGVTRSFQASFDHVTRVIDAAAEQMFVSTSMLVSKGRTVFLGDTSIYERPNARQLANIAVALAAEARLMGHVPRVAILSFSNFGSPAGTTSTQNPREAVALLDEMGVDFEYDGEMSVDIALDYELMKSRYPFCRLSGPANILILPGLHSANISFKLMQQLGGGTVIGPMILGATHPFQIVQMGASVTDIVNAAALAAYDTL